MVSHANFGGIELSIGKGGLRFKKRPSAFNICVGKAIKGGSYSSRQDVKNAFASAVNKCS